MADGELLSVNTFPGNGTQTVFEISFAGGYISPTHVKAYLVSSLGVRTDISFTWVGPNTVQVVPAPELGATLTVYRDTPKVEPLTDFTDGSVLTEQTLDLNARQAVFIAQEAQDAGIDGVNRGLLVPANEKGFTLPATVSRIGRFFAWSSTGSPLALAVAEVAAMLSPFLAFIQKGDKGDPGGSTMSVGLFSQLGSLSVPIGTDTIYTSGYTEKGRGAARYRVGAVGEAGSTGPAFSRTANNRPVFLQEVAATPEMFGAKGDGKMVEDARISASTNVLNSASGKFSASDVGKTIVIAGAGPTNSTTTNQRTPLVATITQYVGATQVILSANASTATTAARALWGTDDSGAITASCKYVSDNGGGTVNFLGTTYTVATMFRTYPNVSLRGAGMGSTLIKRLPAAALANDSSTVIRFGYDGPQGGVVTVEDMTVWGTNWAWLAQGGDQCVSVGQAERFYASRLEVAYSRLFSLSVGYSQDATVTNCYIHDGQRDGINISGTTGIVLVDGCTVDRIGDDCIAVHVPTNVYSGSFMPSVRITNNRICRALGIKVLGGRNVSVTGNQLDRYYGYGVFLGNDPFYQEGITTAWSIAITDNVLNNGLPNYLYGSSAVINAAIFVDMSESLGSGGTAVTTRQGYYDSATNKVATAGKYLHYAGASYPIAPTQGLLIQSNIIKQTLDYTVSKWSGYGMGDLWFSDGPIDPANVTGVLRTISGIRLTGDYDGVKINGNYIDGVGNALSLNAVNRMDNVDFSGNRVVRVSTGVIVLPVDQSKAQHGTVSISKNDFDIDPFMEGSGRNVNGSWSATDGSDFFGVLSFSSPGVRVWDNTFANCRRPYKYLNNDISLKDNTYVWDWSGSTAAGGAGTSKGIGQIIDTDFFNAKHVMRYSDPTKTNYLQYNTPRDSALNPFSEARPSTGWYVPGCFVQSSFGNGNNYDANGRRLAGWRRITWGNTHTDSDWRPVYEYSANPPTSAAGQA